MRRRTAEEWERVLRELDGSGLRQVVFAEQRGISLATLQYQLMRRRQRGQPKSPSFLEVRALPPASRSSVSVSHVEVRIGEHVRVQSEGWPDIEWLTGLVRKLAHP
jgi:hypothetical protein